MGKIGDFFSMTRRERIGSYVVLGMLAIAIALSVALRSCESGSDSKPDMAVVEQLTDSVTVEKPRPAKKHKKRGERKKKSKQEVNNQQGAKGQGGDNDSRQLQEVPQF